MDRDNLADWLLERGDAEAVALLAGDAVVRYAEARARVARRAGELTSSGVDARKIVPLLGDNSIGLVVAYLATLSVGAIPALVPAMSEASVAAVRREIDPSAGAPPDELALLLYTSGSTAAPKGVMLSARNLHASTDAIVGFLGLVASDRAYLPMPLHYCYGLSVLHTHLRVGGSIALGAAQHPDPILDELQASAATGVASVPTFFQMLLRRDALAKRSLPTLRYAMVSGGRLDETNVRALRDALPGARLFMRYGVTELTAAASFVPPESLAEKLGSIGRGLPGLPLAVVDEAGASISPGSDRQGEVVVRGDHVAMGYFRDPTATARAFPDRAFRTGDLARVDGDGFVFLAGRAAEFVKTGGHRVAPREIEEVLQRSPGVAEVCVYGIPHPTRGEALVAALVASPGAALNQAVLRKACANALPAFKIPVAFRVMERLPQTSSGKIDRRTLIDTHELGGHIK